MSMSYDRILCFVSRLELHQTVEIFRTWREMLQSGVTVKVTRTMTGMNYIEVIPGGERRDLALWVQMKM